MRQVCPKTGSRKRRIGEGDDDTTGVDPIVEMLQEMRANFLSFPLFLSLPFSLLFSSPSSSGILFLSLVRTSSLLIADDVTPRPCHVACDQDGRSGSGETTTFSPIFCPVYSRLSLSPFPIFPRCRKNLSSFFPRGRYCQDSLARLGFGMSRIVESFMAAWFPRASISASIFCAPSLPLSRFLSWTFIFWTLSFHLPFSRILVLPFAFFFLSLFHFLIKSSSSSSSASVHSPVSSHSFFFSSLRKPGGILPPSFCNPWTPWAEAWKDGAAWLYLTFCYPFRTLRNVRWS